MAHEMLGNYSVIERHVQERSLSFKNMVTC